MPLLQVFLLGSFMSLMIYWDLPQLSISATLCTIFFGSVLNLVKPTAKKKRIKQRKKHLWHRQHLPYYLVRRCRSRVGNRPESVLTSRQASLAIKTAKQNFQSRKRMKHAKFRRILEYIQDGFDHPTYLKFQLGGLSYSKINTFVNHIDATKLMRTLTCAQVEYIMSHEETQEEVIQALILRANEIARQLNGNDYFSLPLVFDSGASGGLSPFKADFADYQACDIQLAAVTAITKVSGIGTVIYKFVTRSGKVVFIPHVSFHMPSSTVRLFSPQTYFKQFGGSGTMDGTMYSMYLADGEIIDFPIDPHSNLPLAHDCACTAQEKAKYGPRLCAAVVDTFLNFKDIVVEPIDVNHNCKHSCCTCVADETNQNLSGPQKELLLWHWKLSINMFEIQKLMKP